MNFSLAAGRTTCLTIRRSRAQTLRVYATTTPMDKVGGKVSVKDQLVEAKKEVAEVIKTSSCAPILVRLAWHDSGTYDKVRRLRYPFPRAPHLLRSAPPAALGYPQPRAAPACHFGTRSRPLRPLGRFAGHFR